MGERGGGGKQGNYPYVMDRVGEVNDIRITAYNPGRYAQYVPLHFPRFCLTTAHPLLRCHSPYSFASTIVGFSHSHSHPRPHRCTHIAALSHWSAACCAVDDHSRGARTLWRRMVHRRTARGRLEVVCAFQTKGLTGLGEREVVQRWLNTCKRSLRRND